MKLLALNIVLLVMLSIGCTKTTTNNPQPTITWDGNVVAYTPMSVPKTINKKVFAHFMPWFETPVTGGDWGQHWKLNGGNPPATVGSHYYPLNTLFYSNGTYVAGPYGTSDTTVIDYQLLLMKLSGIDGIFIDWPGTLNYADFQKNVSNSNVVISRLANVGLKFAIVYEDQNLQYTISSNQMSQAEADMNYIQNNYFTNPAYETFNGKPLLLDFGPFGPIQSESSWNTIFGTMSNPPAFFAYEGSSYKGGTNDVGEFAWVQQNNLTNLNNFYSNAYGGQKISCAYPGFNSFYTSGQGPTWTIDYNNGSTTTFAQTLALAIQQPGQYIQLVTWNDYGEGTMIEPTTQYQYTFLTTLQQQLGTGSLSQSDLEAVAKLYTARRNNILPTYNLKKMNELDQIFYYMASLKMDTAKTLLQNDF